jgi:hypothetical protein
MLNEVVYPAVLEQFPHDAGSYSSIAAGRGKRQVEFAIRIQLGEASS